MHFLVQLDGTDQLSKDTTKAFFKLILNNMELLQEKYLSVKEAVQDILDQINRLNILIKSHVEIGDADSISVANWREIKRRLVFDLVEILNDIDIDLSDTFKQAA